MSTTIEWTQNPDGSPGKTWNPIRGCSRCSPGCDACYAMRQAHRFSGAGKPFDGLTTIRRGKVDWTGQVRFMPDTLATPLRWRKPQRVFVNSMSDLFHESLENEEILRVFAAMAVCPQHTFMILTKRAKRMHRWFQDVDLFRLGEQMRALDLPANGRAYRREPDNWPLPNVWIGASTENQETAGERIPFLLQCPAAVSFVSYEPALEAVDFSLWMNSVQSFTEACERALGEISLHEMNGGVARFKRERGAIPEDARLSWVIVGGESGNGARPFDPAWARSTVDLGRLTGTPVFCKQLGGHCFAPWKVKWDERLDGSFDAFSSDRVGIKGTNLATVWPNGVWHTWDANGIGGENDTESTVEDAKSEALKALQRQHIQPIKGWARHAHMLRHGKGADMLEWPEELRVRSFPDSPHTAE